MRTMKNVFLAAICAILLSSCAQQYTVTTPEIQAKMLTDLKDGNLTLNCTISCLFTWNQQIGVLQAYDESERWSELYVEVMRIGYRQDLAYYYLGQAAQGLGYHTAALKYYQFANALATGQSAIDQCAAKLNCRGVDIVAVTPILIKASQDALAESTAKSAPAKSVAAQPKPKPKPKPAPANPAWVAPPPANGSTWVAPPPAAGSTWVAPPPAK